MAMRPKAIRSFARGLEVLSALNRHGSATALTLARETGVPRATVYRLLQTLLDDAYVGRGTADDRFHLRLKVRSLSEGFEDEQWISAIAGPALEELTRRISWPCDVSTLQSLKMVIHDTTHRIAPLSIDRNMVGQELPILKSASGLAYIAFARREERQALLALIARSSDPDDALARDADEVSQLIAATRRRGYGLRQGGRIWPHTGSLALPVRVGRRLLGCINTTWMARVLDAKQGVSRCLEPLRETRQMIEQRLAEARRG
jgi:IclR family transcriptional regulator, mhp operon transcriptional activator